MQFPIDNILIVPSKNQFMNEIGDFVTVYTQIPRSTRGNPKVRGLTYTRNRHTAKTYHILLYNIPL